MTKKIIVESCRHCLLRDSRVNDSGVFVPVCIHHVTEGWEIINLNVIQDFCPLSDNETSVSVVIDE